MKIYTQDDLIDAYRRVGVKPGDVVYLLSRLFALGGLKGSRTQEEFLRTHVDAVMAVLGPTGTLVVPTFTPQIGTYGLPFILEETRSTSGIIGEYIRMRPGAVRSLHPVYSLAAIGARADEICGDVSPVAFGAGSAFDNLRRANARCVCIGFPYYAGHIVSLVHHIETLFGVPYIYNKLVRSQVIRGGTTVEGPFIINVRYRHIDYRYFPNRFIDALGDAGMIAEAAIGDSHVYATEAQTMADMGIALLKRDPHAFLATDPGYSAGTIPNEGPPFPPEAAEGVNIDGLEWYL